MSANFFSSISMENLTGLSFLVLSIVLINLAFLLTGQWIGSLKTLGWKNIFRLHPAKERILGPTGPRGGSVEIVLKHGECGGEL